MGHQNGRTGVYLAGDVFLDTHGDAFSDTQFFLPTDNIVENLMSKAGWEFNDRLYRLLPVNFEQKMF